MEKDFFGKISSSVVGKVVCFLVLEFLVIGLYIGVGHKMEVRKIQELPIVVEYDVLSCIEDVEIKKDALVISGWAFRLNSINSKISLILRPTDGSEEMVFSADLFECDDVEEFLAPGWEFGKSGFKVKVKNRELQSDKCYEVLLCLAYKEQQERGMESVTVSARKMIATGQYLYNDVLYRYNPMEFEKPLINDMALKKVIEEGILLAYDRVEHIWIYQHMEKLYFIANPSFGLISESRFTVPIMCRTSRVDLLPEDRKQYGFDHLGVYVENEEYNCEDVRPYQVITVNLSKEYPITYVCTGLYDDEAQGWKKMFVIPMTDCEISN